MMKRWKDEDKDATERAIAQVFRVLLANLLLDIDNPKFREVRQENKSIQKNTRGLSAAFVDFLFETVGFDGTKKEGYYVFTGNMESLKNADRVLSEIEHSWKSQKSVIPPLPSKLQQLRQQQEQERQQILSRSPARRDDTEDALTVSSKSTVFCQEDFDSVKAMTEKVRLTLLNAGRVRNCLFDAKDFVIRRMTHGRVCACTEQCGNDCIEAHWHLLSGKGTLYAFIAHVSSDGSTFLHLGAEYGYQYNSNPGTVLFGKTTVFSIKLIGKDSSLLINDHPNKVCETCIYCAQPFSKLMF